jgi:hypothetical protein
MTGSGSSTPIGNPAILLVPEVSAAARELTRLLDDQPKDLQARLRRLTRIKRVRIYAVQRAGRIALYSSLSGQKKYPEIISDLAIASNSRTKAMIEFRHG